MQNFRKHFFSILGMVEHVTQLTATAIKTNPIYKSKKGFL